MEGLKGFSIPNKGRGDSISPNGNKSGLVIKLENWIERT